MEQRRIDRKKLENIIAALQGNGNAEDLRRLSTTSGGLLLTGHRMNAWPFMLGVPVRSLNPSSYVPRLGKRTRRAPWMDQVRKDIDRSLWGWVSDEPSRVSLRSQLTRVIAKVIERDPEEFHYFQGFHDIAAVALLVCGERLAFELLSRLSEDRLRPWLAPTLAPVQRMLELLFPIVSGADPGLGRFLAESGVPPLFAVSWVLTWFSHTVAELASVERMFDLFLAGEQLLPVYVSAALVLRCRDAVLSLPCELSSVHGFFTRQVPQIVQETDDRPGTIAVEDLVEDSLRLFSESPPWMFGADPRPPPGAGAGITKKTVQAVAVAVLASSVTAGVLVAGVVLTALR